MAQQNLPRFVRVSCGDAEQGHSAAIAEGGNLYTWGSNGASFIVANISLAIVKAGADVSACVCVAQSLVSLASMGRRALCSSRCSSTYRESEARLVRIG